MRRVIVHVDRLILNGIDRADQHAFAAGLQVELVELLRDRETIDRLRGAGELPQLQVDRVDLAHDASPRAIGAATARGIVREVPG